MPQWRITTNVPQSKIPPNFLQEATELFQKTIGKPVMVSMLCSTVRGVYSYSKTCTP